MFRVTILRNLLINSPFRKILSLLKLLFAASISTNDCGDRPFSLFGHIGYSDCRLSSNFAAHQITFYISIAVFNSLYKNKKRYKKEMDMEKAGPSSRNPQQQLQLEQSIGMYVLRLNDNQSAIKPSNDQLFQLFHVFIHFVIIALPLDNVLYFDCSF